MQKHDQDISTTMEWSRRKFFQALALFSTGFLARTDSFGSALPKSLGEEEYSYTDPLMSSPEPESVGGMETISLGYLTGSDKIAFLGDLRALQSQVEELAARQYRDVNPETVGLQQARSLEDSFPLSTVLGMPPKRTRAIVGGPRLAANLVPAEKIEGDSKLVGEKIHVTLTNLLTSPDDWKKKQQGMLAYRASWPTPIQTECNEVKELTYIQAFRVNKRDNRLTNVTNHQILRNIPVQDVLNIDLSLIKVSRRDSKIFFEATLEFIVNHKLFVHGVSPFVPYANAASEIFAHIRKRFGNDPRIWDEQILSLNPAASEPSSEYKLRTGTYLAVGGMFNFEHHSYTGPVEPGPLATIDDRGKPVKVNRNCLVFHISRA